MFKNELKNVKNRLFWVFLEILFYLLNSTCKHIKPFILWICDYMKKYTYIEIFIFWIEVIELSVIKHFFLQLNEE